MTSLFNHIENEKLLIGSPEMSFFDGTETTETTVKEIEEEEIERTIEERLRET